MPGEDEGKRPLVIGGGASEDESSDELVFSSAAKASPGLDEEPVRPMQPPRAIGSGPVSRTLQLPAVTAPPPSVQPLMRQSTVVTSIPQGRTEKMPAVVVPPGTPPNMPSVSVGSAMPAVGGATVRSAAPTGPARQPMLQIMDPWGRPAFEYPLQPGRVMIGREQADLPLTQDPTISRWHASLLWRAGALTLEDMASTNGVFLRIADAFLLEDGDEFALGLHRFVFLSTSPALRYKPEREVDGVRLAGGASAAAFPRLMHLLEGGVIGGLYPLGERFHIGNKQGELVCPDDMSMSGTHAVIERRQHAFYLRDLASALGSYIRINSPVELLDGDSFLVGRTRIAVRLP